jgi:hypothetical protein
VTALYFILGLIALAALALTVPLLVRRPAAVSLYALVAVFVLSFAAWPFESAATGNVVLLGMDQLDARTVSVLLRMTSAYCLFVFTFASMRGPARRMATLAQALPLVAAGIGVVAAARCVPPELRDVTAGLAAGGEGALGVVSSGLFNLLANAYFAYSYGAALVWLHQARRTSSGPLRRSATIVEAGLVLLVTSSVLFSVSNVVRMTGVQPARWLGVVGIASLVPGFVIFVVGMLRTAVHALIERMRLRLYRRELYRELEPLWSALDDVFPGHALETGPRGLWRRITPDTVQWRFHRRVIECRDGLVRLSPFLPEGDPTGDDLLRAMADARAVGGDAGTAHARVIAAAPGAGVDEDAESMVVLARRLREAAAAPEEVPAGR